MAASARPVPMAGANRPRVGTPVAVAGRLWMNTDAPECDLSTRYPQRFLLCGEAVDRDGDGPSTGGSECPRGPPTEGRACENRGNGRKGKMRGRPDNRGLGGPDTDRPAGKWTPTARFGPILLTIGLEYGRLSPVDRSTERSIRNGGCSSLSFLGTQGR